MLPASILCPQCGYSPEYNEKLAKNNLYVKENLRSIILKKIFPTKKTGGWIMA
jgi:hypothetical protein